MEPVCAICTIGLEIILDAPDGMTRLKWKLDSDCSEIMLTLTQDRCTVCAQHTIGSKIILDAPVGTPR
jgi:hypothetical protein